jgi:hypothetical protein
MEGKMVECDKSGIETRDLLAGLAMLGFMVVGEFDVDDREGLRAIAQDSYLMAEYMLDAREGDL